MLHAAPAPAAPAPAIVADHCEKGSRECFPHDLTAPTAQVPLPQCGGEDEDHKDCSREGRQAPAGGWVEGRGSGRIALVAPRWYRVVTAHDEMIYTAAGEPMEEKVIIEGFNLELPDTFMGLGTAAAVEAHVEVHYPGYEVVDFWSRSAPATEF